MALRVWLPLNGNINNYGISDVVPINIGSPRFSSSGKIGKAIQISNDGQAISLPNYMGQCGNYVQYSMCAWIHLDSTATNHSASIMSSGDWNSGTRQCCFALYNYSSNGYTKLLVPNSNGWSDGINLPTPVSLSKWYHIAITFDGSKTYGYINGEYIGSYNGGKITSTSESSNLYIGAATYYSGFTLKGKINDVRIYDNCLSTKEVKEISKGLCLHYKLSGSGHENLFSKLYYEYSPSIWGYSIYSPSGASTVKPVLQSNGDLLLTGPGIGGNDQCYIANSSKLLPMEENTEYTISVTIKPNGAGNYRFYWYDFDSNGRIWGGNKQFTFSSGDSERTVSWTRTTTAGTTKCYWELNMIASATTSTMLLKANSLKLEKGPIATYWSPNSSDSLYSILGYNNNIEYDCSGYSNNGTKSGTIVCESGSPRYATSYKFNGSSCIKNNQFYFDSPIWTVSLWYKYSTAPTAYEGLICLSKNDGSDSNKKFAMMPNSNYIWFKTENNSITMSSLKVGEWCHLALVSNGTSAIIYENGVQKGTATISSSITGAYDLVVGARASSAGAATTAIYNKGNISDVRVYATALSADDIKQLYNSPISVDKTGNLFAAEFNDTQATKPSFNKNGVINSNDYLEYGEKVSMSISKDNISANELIEF